MDELRGEHIAQLAIDDLQEREHIGVAGTEHIIADTPHLPYLVGTARTAQMGIDVEGSLHMAREVDLGDDVDITFGSIAHNLATVVLGVVAAIGLTVEHAAVATDDGLLSYATFRCQVGKSLHLETPALVVGEMPVELVAAVQGQQVEIALDDVDGEEMTGTVEVHAAIAEAGRIVDGGIGKQDGRLGFYRQTLTQGLDATEDALGLGGLDGDAFLVDGEGIGLAGQSVGLIHEAEPDGASEVGAAMWMGNELQT